MTERTRGEAVIGDGVVRNQVLGGFDVQNIEELRQFKEIIEGLAGPIFEELLGLRKRVDQILERQTGVLDPNDPFWETYHRDMPDVKDEIAEYTCKTFIVDHLRSFVQASTTALRLALHIAKHHVKPNVLHTNSIFFPLAVLPANSHHMVYTFCGPVYDSMCGGWFFHEGETGKVLQELFTRQKDPLTTSFLSPIAVKPDTGPYYVRAEAAQFASYLIEGAKKIVIMAPANRLYTEEQPFGDNKRWSRAWFGGDMKEMHIVISGSPAEGDYRDLVGAFLHATGQIKWRVHWKDPGDGKWKCEK